ncbi:helix-turn-helix domain-containing protein [Streptomyces sp. NBC_01635]|uniref:helix-turn-helix domain-containing protein n=1 Tax=Streptomyces sp. NBC_01635 TaxID=2975904 RepID=UPI0038697B9A|nr:helix-turn-helix domain-containing protein [Streptomyces sp. NBC_01635]
MTTKQMSNDTAVDDVWGSKSPWDIDREKREAAEKVAKAVREEERRKAAWVDMTNHRYTEWLYIVAEAGVKASTVHFAVGVSQKCGKNSHGYSEAIGNTAKRLGMSTPTANRAMAELKEKDLIRKAVARPGTSDIWRIGAVPNQD